MKTTVIESGKNTAVNAKANNTNGTGANGGSTNPALQKPNSGLTPSKAFDSTATKAEEPKKTESSAPAQITPEAPKTADQPKAETSKAELREGLTTQKPALNLEGTLKLVEELHRRKVQRDKLLDTIETLEEFEVAQKDDAEETGSNHFQGCELTIEDDNRRQFVTKNPFIIRKVAEYINALCMDRLAEIEGEIQLPA